jgi:uncharacterized membrane protein
MQTQGMADKSELEQATTEFLDKAGNVHGAGLAQRKNRTIRRARGLGWFSVALGALELVAPDAMASVAGARIRPKTRTTILSDTRSAWLWARVAGDAMDLALIGKTLASPKCDQTRAMAALGSVLGVTALDVKSAVELTQSEQRGFAPMEGIHVVSAITVNRPRDEVYRYWRDLENLPKFMAHLESVEAQNGRSKWRAKGPLGVPIEWEAEIVADQPNELLAWRSCEGSDVPNQGSVRFLDAPAGRGTEVRIELRYDPPTGALGAAVARLFGTEPGQAIAGDLRRFKQVIETGEVVHSDASVHKGRHPARPSPEASGEEEEKKRSLGGASHERDRSSEPGWMGERREERATR